MDGTAETISPGTLALIPENIFHYILSSEMPVADEPESGNESLSQSHFSIDIPLDYLVDLFLPHIDAKLV